MPHIPPRYPLAPDEICPKCDDIRQPNLRFLKKTTTLPERIEISCATCGWVAGTKPCADAPGTPA